MYHCINCSRLVPKVSLYHALGYHLVSHGGRHIRCLAPADNLDGNSTITPRTAKHTADVVRDFELLQAWDSYGMVGDVVVLLQSSHLLRQILTISFKFECSLLVRIFLVLTFTSCCRPTSFIKLSKELLRTTS